MKTIGAIAISAIFSCAPQAFASSSAWHDTPGGRVRLITTGAPDAQGKLRGALEIDLKPGWKTYWRDPGASGVPPSIDASSNPNVAAVSIDFPAPIRVNDGGSAWAGYDRPTSLLVTFDTKAPPGVIDARVFLGICETICIPVQATLSIDPAADPNNSSDASRVLAAFLSLPQPAMPDFQAVLTETSPDSITIEARGPGAPETTELFLVCTETYMFGTPKRRIEGGKSVFTVAILNRPKQKPEGAGLHYTLTGDEGSVAGTIPFF